jgi:hypothetical protein
VIEQTRLIAFIGYEIRLKLLTQLPQATAPWIAAALIWAPDVIAAEALISHLHPCPERTDGGKIFDCETNCICRRGKATITDVLTRTMLAFWHE